MRKALLIAFMLLSCGAALARDKEEDRVRDAGTVFGEILNIPDNIPKDLLNKAECVLVLPSVKKFAIGIGGSYGRGVIPSVW